MMLTLRFAASAAVVAGALVPAVTAAASDAPGRPLPTAPIAAAGRMPGLSGAAAVAARGTQLWASLYLGPGGSTKASGMVVSPDGAQVFATGTSAEAGGTTDFVTVAYNTATGARLWSQKLCGFSMCSAADVKVSPDGSTVYVTGQVPWAGPPDAYGTEAISAATGRKLWRERYEQGFSTPASLAVSPDGSMIYVTGTTGTTTVTPMSDYTTVAYHATGAQAWVAHYAGPVKDSTAASVAVSPDGATVYVTGTSGARPAKGVAYTRIVTIAYSAATGSQLWRAQYGVRKQDSSAVALAVSPHGSTVFAAGTEAEDLLLTADGAPQWLSSPRVAARCRGTGCALASAIAAGLASGQSIEDACRNGKQYVHSMLTAKAS